MLFEKLFFDVCTYFDHLGFYARIHTTSRPAHDITYLGYVENNSGFNVPEVGKDATSLDFYLMAHCFGLLIVPSIRGFPAWVF